MAHDYVVLEVNKVLKDQGGKKAIQLVSVRTPKELDPTPPRAGFSVLCEW